jgi:hypothetical protein
MWNEISSKGEKWAQAVSLNFDLECVDTANLDSLRFISNRELVICVKDCATIVYEEVKECPDKNFLFADEDPTIIDKGKVEECANDKISFSYEDPATIGKCKVEECFDEKILLSDEDPATNNKEEAKVWNDVKHCQSAQSTQRFACRRQTILMLRSISKIETSFMSCVNTGADIVHWNRDAHKVHRAFNTFRWLASSPYSRTADIVRMCRLLYSRRKMEYIAR